MMKKAVVFYSLSGNTQAAAKEIAEGIGADLIELKLVKPFPTEKSKQLALGGMQAMFGMKPAIQELSKNIKEYDVLILGTPIWAGTIAAPVHSFLNKYQVLDKIVAVFTFSGGGDNKRCIAKLSKRLPRLKVEVALANRDSDLAIHNADKIHHFIKEVERLV
ncbi:flavodoxin [Firmicutes bacterium AM41-11]|jgi:flavodoxin|nr:flavodoxin [Firmicutes bacterium AM41-11]